MVSDKPTGTGPGAKVRLRGKLRHNDIRALVNRLMRNVDRTGMFWPGDRPLAVGTHVEVQLFLANDTLVLSFLGQVRWIRRRQPEDPGVVPGMHLAFIDVPPKSRRLLERVVTMREQSRQKVRPAPAPGVPRAESEELPGWQRAESEELPGWQPDEVSSEHAPTHVWPQHHRPQMESTAVDHPRTAWPPRAGTDGVIASSPPPPPRASATSPGPASALLPMDHGQEKTVDRIPLEDSSILVSIDEEGDGESTWVDHGGRTITLGDKSAAPVRPPTAITKSLSGGAVTGSITIDFDDESDLAEPPTLRLKPEGLPFDVLRARLASGSDVTAPAPTSDEDADPGTRRRLSTGSLSGSRPAGKSGAHRTATNRLLPWSAIEEATETTTLPNGKEVPDRLEFLPPEPTITYPSRPPVMQGTEDDEFILDDIEPGEDDGDDWNGGGR